MVVLKPQKWRRQPTGAVEINQSHWAAKALIHAFIPSSTMEPNFKSLWLIQGNPSFTASPFGRSLASPTSTNYVSINALADHPTKIIIVSRVKHNTAASSNAIVVGQPAATNVPYMLSTNYNSATVVRGMAFFDGSWHNSDITTDIGNTGWHDVAGSYDGSTLTYYVDRKIDKQTAFTGSLPGTTGNTVDIGTYRSGPAGFDGLIEYVYILDGNKLNPNVEVVSELQKEPYSLFLPIRKKIYFNTVASLGPSATLNVTEASDTIVASATTPISATLSVTEAADTITSGVTHPILETFTVTEADDTISTAATVTNSGVNASANVTESADTITSGVTLPISGSLTVTEDNDTAYGSTQTPVVVVTAAGGGSKRTPRKKLRILPDGNRIMASEEEVRKILETFYRKKTLDDVKLQPPKVQAKFKEKPVPDVQLVQFDKYIPKVYALNTPKRMVEADYALFLKSMRRREEEDKFLNMVLELLDG
jgi:hypothetical protein